MKKMYFLKITRFFVLVLLFEAGVQCSWDDDYSEEEVKRPSCDSSNCRLPKCSCFGAQPNVSVHARPQLVMLTFDDAITAANIGTYRKIIENSNVRLTFYVCHEYNDYTLANELQSKGHEIAVHTVSHRSNTDLWREGSAETWTKELVNMRDMLSRFALIDKSEVVGHRAPFLQTAGDVTFRVLKNQGFLYDSSMPTRSYMDPPIWPYTLDYGYSQDCQIQPCPSENFEGVWLIPMIQYLRSSKEGDFFCSMVDACTPQPITANDTKAFLMDNFNRHYRSNKAPFPVFLHEGWLRDAQRLQGYLQFVEEISRMKDVRIVTMRDVVDYMQSPVPYEKFTPRPHKAPQSCGKGENCYYQDVQRIMRSCVTCSKYYPWVDTPQGKRPSKNFPSFD